MEIETWVTVEVDGALHCEGRNVVVTQGFEVFARAAAGFGVPTHMALGSNGDATLLAMTELEAEVLRVPLASREVDGGKVTFLAEFDGGVASPALVQEIGIFDAASDGRMLCRFLPLAFTFNPTSTVRVTWAVTFGG